MEDFLFQLTSSSQYQFPAVLTRIDHYRLLIVTTPHPLKGTLSFTKDTISFEAEVLKCSLIELPHYNYFSKYLSERNYITVLSIDAGLYAIPIAPCCHGDMISAHFYTSIPYKSTGIISNLNESVILVNGAYVKNCRGFITSENSRRLYGVIIPWSVSESFCIGVNVYEILKDLIDPSMIQEKLREKEYDSIVKVMGRGCQGSGVVISKKQIVTNLHVIKGSESAAVFYRGKWIEAKVVKTGVYIDIAILEIQAELIPLEICKDLRPGQMVKAIGFCNFCIDDSQAVISSGTLCKVVELNSKPIILQTSAVIYNGCSGGAILDSSNRLLGIITSNARIGDKLFPSLNLAISHPVLFDDSILLSSDKIYDEIQSYETGSIIPQYYPRL
jgi:hypothetical protein